MARKVEKHTVTADNRDKGKTFIITEMSAMAGHRWACKALLAMLNSGIEMPEELAQQGVAGLAVMGMGALTKLPEAVVLPLLDELMTCVQIQQEIMARPLVEEDFEEVITIFDLQKKALMLHIAPFISGAGLTSA